jgi:hypothetical protein
VYCSQNIAISWIISFKLLYWDRKKVKGMQSENAKIAWFSFFIVQTFEMVKILKNIEPASNIQL